MGRYARKKYYAEYQAIEAKECFFSWLIEKKVVTLHRKALLKTTIISDSHEQQRRTKHPE
ncbi:MAG: hypothetical protein KBT28_12685 [Bacteroidales bacterium]|nr:hypothetical protein [Candidatus Colimorpha merdihippi]